MNPFDQLIRLAEGRRARPRLPAPMAQRDTKAATLIGYLQEAGPASTSTLASLIGLHSRLVWGLLKAPRDRGQVQFYEGMWSFVDAFDEQQHADIGAAAALLRRHGWTVRPPEN
jgi:hypothetical protein